jgi:hypothetical protein
MRKLMAKYPSAEEREQIVATRRQLMGELIGCLVTTDEREQRKGFDRLVRRYGPSEVERTLTFLRRGLQGRDLDNDEAILYREYVEYYRRFGGQRPFLTLQEHTQANEEFGLLAARQEVGQTLSEAEQERLACLSDLLLKETMFWEDLVPEDPPSTMPEVDLPPVRPSAPPRTAQQVQDRYPICERDGFPMLTINGRLECSAEYIDRCVGQQPVVDVIQRGETMHYVFENGHELPLLCSCCGGPLQVDNLEKERKGMRGRRLESMSVGIEMLESGRKSQALFLEFSKAGLFSRAVSLPVAFEVAARLRHPAGCPYRKQASTSTKKGRSRKRTRRKRR